MSNQIPLQNEIIDRSEMEFIIFCIENIARKLNVSGNEVFDSLSFQSNILDSYIIPNYEILHTQSKEYILEDILTIMKEAEIMI